jgi:outer membrane protein assembly factor BamB
MGAGTNHCRLSSVVELRSVSAMKLLLLLVLSVGLGNAALEWPQWGGPHRNFQSDAKGLADSWPATGPKQLWTRSLGEGYSAISIDGDRLFTMYRRGTEEVVIAMDANTGKTIWEYKYGAAFRPGMSMENGPGPHSTPLIAGGQLYTVGINGMFHCFDKKMGKLLWSHDLLKEYGGTPMGRGYSSSPIAYRNLVLVTVGEKGHAVMAFEQKDGSVVWKNQDFKNSGSSPVLIKVDGLDQLVIFMSDEIAGLNPLNGDLQWKYPHKTDWGLNLSTPVWGDDNLLFCSSAYSGGSEVFQITRSGNQTSAKQLWFMKQMRLHHGNAIRIGDYIYGSSGDFGPAPLTAVHVKTGKIAWQDRSFSKANLVYADGKLIAVEEDGNVALAKVSPEGLQVISKAALLRSNAWTAPSLAGTKLYLRDRSTIMALDLK